MNYIQEIVSGGQTGVDRAALDAAIALEIPHGGWCPFGRKAEDGVIPQQYNLKETNAPSEETENPDTIYKQRTELNVCDSDGTLIITKGSPTGGTFYTIQMAEKHHKPYFVIDISIPFKNVEVINWIKVNKIHKLNVAGPRASQIKDIYNAAYDILINLLPLINTEFTR